MGRALVLTFVALGLLSAAFAAPAQAADRDIITQELQAADGADTTFKAYWKNGLNFKTSDGKFAMKISGRIQLDTWFYADSDLRDLVNGDDFDIDDFEFYSGAEFRRVRLAVIGDIYDYVAWKAQFDFAPSDTEFRDMYIRLHNLDKCWGCWFPDITMGHFKEYFSLEAMTSSKYTNFMERSMAVEAFAPLRNIGIGFDQTLWGGRFYYGLGWWSETPGEEEGKEIEFFRERAQHVGGRLVFMPWAPCDCESQFWQIGISGSYRYDAPIGYRFRTRPEIHLADRTLDTGVLSAETCALFGLETAFVYDRFKLQAEWMGAMPSLRGAERAVFGEDVTLHGGYVSAHYLLGGKGYSYKRRYQTFDKITPCSNFDCSGCGSWGAWELGIRWSHLDLTEVSEGKADNFTVGINWYLNANTKIMFNYVYSDITNFRGIGNEPNFVGPSLDGEISAFGIRIQVFW